MKQQATVVSENGVLKAEVLRPEACQACHACQIGRVERMLVDLPPGAYHEGQVVELTLPDGQVSKASLIAYGIPLVGFGLGLFIGWKLGLPELYQALCALVLLVVSAFIVRLIDKRIRKSGAYKPVAAPCGVGGFTENNQKDEDQ